MIESLKNYKPSKAVLHPFDPLVKFFLPIIPKWMLPNYFSALRIVFTPYVGYLLWIEHFWPAFIWFFVLALTDMFDGSIARLRDKITPVGIVLDPVADKVLIGTVVAILLVKINGILAAVVIGLELLFLIGGVIKTSTNHQAVDLEANIWGKTKMTLQVIGVSLIFIGLLSGMASFIFIAQGIIWLAALFAVINLFIFSL